MGSPDGTPNIEVFPNSPNLGTPSGKMAFIYTHDVKN